MIKRPEEMTIKTQSDLLEAWAQLMGPGGFGGESIWMMLIVDDAPSPQLIEMTDSHEPPDPQLADGLASFLRMLEEEIAPGARVAFLRSRPGVEAITENDRAWAQSLYEGARRAGVPCEVVHLATRGVIRPVTLDDLGPEAARR